MNSLVLHPIPFSIDTGQLQPACKIKEGSELGAKLSLLAAKAESIGRPKAFYKPAFIKVEGDDRVIIEGVKFTSRVLRVNLEKVHQVFPFAATCGLELEAWSKTIGDPMEKHWADAIKETAVRTAMRYLREHLMDQFQYGKMARMNPGSLPDWPLKEQQPLFSVLGKGPRSIGITLLDSLFMEPLQSVSGIWFPVKEDFESCQLCPGERCRGRRAPYDPDLYNRKYRLP